MHLRLSVLILLSSFIFGCVPEEPMDDGQESYRGLEECVGKSGLLSVASDDGTPVWVYSYKNKTFQSTLQKVSQKNTPNPITHVSDTTTRLDCEKGKMYRESDRDILFRGSNKEVQFTETLKCRGELGGSLWGDFKNNRWEYCPKGN